MGTFNANILPAQTGLVLGSSNQQWIAYLSNAFTGTIQSLSANVALSGFLRLASTDTIAWRNNANTADVTLSKTGAASTTTPADTLVFNGSGIEGPFISHNGNPASTGELRLNTSDFIYFRNNANNGDVVGLQHNTDDTVTAGGAAGIKEPIILSATANPAASGVVRLANADQINWRNNGNSADEGISNASTGGLLLNGANPNISFGGVTSSFPMLKRNGGQLQLKLADNSAFAALDLSQLNPNAGPVTGYNGYTLAGNGLISEIIAVDLTAQTAAITTTNLVTASGSGPAAGQYRLSWNAKVTTAAGVSSTLGALTIVYTDPDAVVQTITCGAQVAAGTIATTSTANTTTTVLLGLPFIMNIKALTNITYAFGYASNAANAMAYNLHITLERM